MEFRRATRDDLASIIAIYDAVHDAEATGEITTGWLRGVYPTRETALGALEAGDLYVETDGGRVVASGRINREQVDVYANIDWLCKAKDDEVLVMHTLTVDPACKRRGYGRAFEAFYAKQARRLGCTALRIDTNARNTAARRMYAVLGYREAGIVSCVFNGIEGVNLVCLEKRP